MTIRHAALHTTSLGPRTRSVVRSIARFAHEPDPDLRFIQNGRVEFQPNHTFSGNPLRLGQAAIEVHPDEAWRAKMSRREKVVATATALPLLKRYGYRRQTE